MPGRGDAAPGAPMRLLASALALALTLSLLAVAAPATAAAPGAAAPQCIGVPPSGGPLFTGFCRNDPNCPSPSPTGSGTGYYVLGALVACSLN